jgi:hypothetical protein
MSRLLSCCVVFLAGLRPALAAVCDNVLGSGFERLINAPLWYAVGDRVLSPVNLILIALAFLTATKMPRLRGMALIAALLTAVQAVSAIGANVFPDDALLAARIEGCGSASLSTAIVSSALALMLAAAFVVAPERAPRV